MPSRLTSPWVGFRPTTPQAEAGIRIEPPVSVPIAATAMPVATAMAEPLLEPPALRSGATGLRVMPNADSSPVVPKASSCRLHLPTITASASRRRVTMVRVGAAPRSRRVGREAAVVGTPLEVDQVFQRDRNPLQRAAILPVGQPLVGAARFRSRFRLAHQDEGVQLAVPAGDGGEAVVHQRAGCFPPGAKGGAEVRNRLAVHPQIIASSWNASPRSNRAGSNGVRSMRFDAPVVSRSAIAAPTAGDIIRPWPLKPFAR